ncbi:4965_t:CDS:2, partial [Funneliformis caledonium]
STRTRHRKRNDENSSVLDSILSSSSETASILSLSDVCTSSRSESSILIELFGSNNMISTAENLSVDEGYIDEESTIQDIDDNYEPSLGRTSSNGTDEFSDSNISHIEISESEEHIHLSDELACAIRLFQVKSQSTWMDICINSYCAYTGKYKDDELYHLKIQYQDPKGSERLKYHINYTHRQGFRSNGKIGDIFDGVRYQNLLSNGYFEDDRNIALT